MDKGGAKAERGYPGPTRGALPVTQPTMTKYWRQWLSTVAVINDGHISYNKHSFRAFTLMDVWQKDKRKSPTIPLVSRGCLPEDAEEDRSGTSYPRSMQNSHNVLVVVVVVAAAAAVAVVQISVQNNYYRFYKNATATLE